MMSKTLMARKRLIENPLLHDCDRWPDCWCEDDCRRERERLDRYLLRPASLLPEVILISSISALTLIVIALFIAGMLARWVF